MKQPKWQHFVLGVSLMLLFLGGGAFSVAAQSAEKIEEQIEDTSERIEELDEEIDVLSGELQSTRSEAATLEQAVSQLDNSVERLSGQVNETESSIASTQNRIMTIEETIAEIEADVKKGRGAIASTIHILQQSGSQTLVETLLSADSLADAWGRMDQLNQIQSEVQKRLVELRKNREVLASRQTEAQRRQAELADLQEQYVDQRAIIESQQEEKAELLELTKQEASEYETMIAEKRAQKEAFEAQLRNFEAQLQSSGATVPEGASQFVWPVSPVIITQQFGGSEFAKRNPGVYGRPFHNGTDFGVPVGTPVRSVSAGTVRATGNTDAYAGCYSYGKWVLVDHDNGLSTLYAHLSRIASSAGQRVAQGERIGYSGNTGYSTGPHLHLTAYVQQDVRVVALGEVKTRTNCAAAEIPVAPLESYLNSMKYLPNL